jgi:predicted GIY-YIG superfamily endonuclease
VKPFFAYMLRCADGSYYVGHTDDLERRIAEHRAGAIAGCYTHDRRPVELVWSGEATTREEALAFERRLKGWSRAKKEALIAGDWERVSKLATSGAGLRQAQPERGAEDGPGHHSLDPAAVRTEPVEGPGPAAHGLRQAQPERGGEARQGRHDLDPAAVRPEPVEGPGPNARGLRLSQRVRGG